MVDIEENLRLATEKAAMTNLWPHPVISQKAGYDFGLEDIPEEARVCLIPIFLRRFWPPLKDISGESDTM